MEIRRPEIPFVDLFTDTKSQAIDGIFSEIRKIAQSSQFILGSVVADFEKKYAELAGCPFGVGVNSGLDALLLSLRALGVGPGDEVITAPNSFIASAAAVALVGAKPVFVDVDTDYNINPSLIEAAVTKRTKAIIPVHLTGNPCKMTAIMEIAKKNGLKVIEDAAQAIGATYEGQLVGSFGDAGAFSLHPLKNLHVWGDGGMITTRSKELADVLKLHRNHGLKNRDEVEFYSYNSRLDTLHAAVGLVYLKLLEDTTAKRIQNAKLYDERLSELSDTVKTPIVDRERAKHVFHVYVIWAKDRDRLVNHLLSKGIETKVHYPIPIHLQKASAYLGYKKGNFPVTEHLAQGILSIPVRENLSESQINKVCDAIWGFYKK